MPLDITTATQFSSTGISSPQEIGRSEIMHWIRTFADADTLSMISTACMIGFERIDLEAGIDAELAWRRSRGMVA